jgi:thiol-disulfide isomerase/thioredoxin
MSFPHICAGVTTIVLIGFHGASAQSTGSGHAGAPRTPGGCLAAGEQYRDSAYHALNRARADASIDSAAKQRANAAMTRGYAALDRAALARNRKCAATFNVATIDFHLATDLGVLYFRAGQRELAGRAFARAFGRTGLRDTARANAMVTAMTAYIAVYAAEDPRNVALSAAFIPRIDSIPDALEQRVRARSLLSGLSDNDTADDRRAHEIFALADQMSPAQVQRTASDIGGAYGQEAMRYGDRLEPDSALALLRSAPAELRDAPAIARYEMVGRPAPALHADTWINGMGSERNPGVTLVVFTAWWCHDCLDSYPYITALEREFGPRGLHLVFAVALEGQFRGVTMLPAQEVKADSGYYREHGFTCPIAIYHRDMADTLGTVAPSDTSNASRYRIIGWPAFYIVDKDGILRAEIVGWAAGSRRDHELHSMIERLLSGPSSG